MFVLSSLSLRHCVPALVLMVAVQPIMLENTVRPRRILTHDASSWAPPCVLSKSDGNLASSKVCHLLLNTLLGQHRTHLHLAPRGGVEVESNDASQACQEARPLAH